MGYIVFQGFHPTKMAAVRYSQKLRSLLCFNSMLGYHPLPDPYNTPPPPPVPSISTQDGNVFRVETAWCVLTSGTPSASSGMGGEREPDLCVSVSHLDLSSNSRSCFFHFEIAVHENRTVWPLRTVAITYK